MTQKLTLPDVVSRLVQARKEVVDHYKGVLRENDSSVALSFTFDGNLVGDIGEALAVEFYGVRLVHRKSTEGIDGYLSSGKTVQVKATGTGRGPAFRKVETQADYLLFFDIDFDSGIVEVIFNGPEHYATSLLPDDFSGQRSLTARQIRMADAKVDPIERIVVVRKVE